MSTKQLTAFIRHITRPTSDDSFAAFNTSIDDRTRNVILARESLDAEKITYSSGCFRINLSSIPLAIRTLNDISSSTLTKEKYISAMIITICEKKNWSTESKRKKKKKRNRWRYTVYSCWISTRRLDFVSLAFICFLIAAGLFCQATRENWKVSSLVNYWCESSIYFAFVQETFILSARLS